MEKIRYDVAGALTAIAEDLGPLLAGLPATPLELCLVAQGLVVPPDLAIGFGIPEERHGEKSVRAASDIIRTLGHLADRPIDEPRSFPDRVVGTCRHFSVLTCALLRHRGVPARSRCGFASYFVPDRYVDHWVVEYWHGTQQRWARVDPEILGFDFVSTPEDLAEGDFLSGGEAWALCRQGEVDPARFGVDGVAYAWGIAEVRGNAVRDLAALNKVEMLPWDEWGRMESSYANQTGADYDELMDAIAATCTSNDEGAIRRLYASEDLTVPESMVV